MFIIMQNMQQLKSAYEPYAFSHKNFLHDYKANNWLKTHGDRFKFCVNVKN